LPESKNISTFEHYNKLTDCIMAQKDWRDILGSSLTSFPEADSEIPVESESKKAPTNRQELIIRFEKRNGKPTTIISNFLGSEKDLKDLAASLK